MKNKTEIESWIFHIIETISSTIETNDKHNN